MRLFASLLALGAGAILSAQQSEISTLDRMSAAGKSQKEIAQYVFDTHGCKDCHTVGPDGKTGFTEKGRAIGKGFEGCVSMLSAMNLVAQVSADQRTPEQKKRAARFGEFGCTFCHKITPGKMGLTDVGAKLAHMHLGCVQVEQQVANKK